MVNNTIEDQEKGWRKVVLEEIGKYRRGVSITKLVSICEISRDQMRVTLAFLLGSGKIQEERVGMAKLYYSI